MTGMSMQGHERLTLCIPGIMQDHFVREPLLKGCHGFETGDLIVGEVDVERFDVVFEVRDFRAADCGWGEWRVENEQKWKKSRKKKGVA